jgi:signal transduction histidine kinase
VARRTIRSISVPITFGAVTVPLSAALLVGWTIFTAHRINESGESAWLLVLGVISFVVIMSVLVMFTVFLAREILEVRRQDTFIDSVTHELKSPLASIKLCLQTLERDDLPEEKRQTLRRMIQDDVSRLSAFIDDVLQASRLAHDDVETDLDAVQLDAVVAQAVEAVAARHKIDRSDVRISVPEGLGLVTDRAALEIVLRNLVDNAVKYSPRPVAVEVRCTVEPGAVAIDVTDRGIGIPPRELARVFQRFYRVDHESVRKRKGTGLGLFVVSALVRNLGGTVRASSPGPGLGATFHVRLPQRAEARAGGGSRLPGAGLATGARS